MTSRPPESRALAYIAEAEHSAALRDADTLWASAVHEAAVIGAGRMGVGIAMAFLDAGIRVLLLDADAEALERGVERLKALYARAQQKGRIDVQQHANLLERLTPVTGSAALHPADIIVEAVVEDLSVKQEVFKTLDAQAKPNALLATNTSYLSVADIAAATARPAQVLGLHFFSPANLMRLCEVVAAPKTSTETLEKGFGIARRLGKLAILSTDSDGFIGNHMLAAYRLEAMKIALEGTAIAEIDAALEAFGMPMGPFRMSDLAGLDIGYRNRKSKPEGSFDPREGYVPDRLVEAGCLGQKTGIGYYRYEDGTRIPLPNRETKNLIAQAASVFAVVPRENSAAHIVERCMVALAKVGVRLLQEGVAASAGDVDLVYINGYGFPKAQGGPLYWTSMVLRQAEIRGQLAEIGAMSSLSLTDR